ncbi:MAG: acyl--CoA ligase [Verrucomicrobiales bacterium]|nr:acyl--CoA ligase [Verrucomicrobiales bacterium]
MDSGHASTPGSEPEVTIQEITLALVGHPAVAEASVVPCRLPDGGRQVVAFVVPRGNACDASELQTHVSSQLGDRGRPDKVVFLEALPRSVSGKVDRRRLETGEFNA